MKTKAIAIIEQRERENYIAVMKQRENEKQPMIRDVFKIGDTIRVDYLRVNLKDASKKDKFIFEGIAYGINKRSQTLYVLKPDKDKSLSMIAHFPLNSPNIAAIRLISSAPRTQKRNKAYYLEKLSGKKASMKIIG